MRPTGLHSLAGLVALASLSAMGASLVRVGDDDYDPPPPRKSLWRRYRLFVGPPHPASRQHRRQLERASRDALARLQPTPDYKR